MVTSSSISSYAIEDLMETDPANQWHIHLRGRVQGVGFRPFVYQLASTWGMKGAVSNGLNGVHIWLQANEQDARRFYREILHNPPPLSVITGSSFASTQHRHTEGFRIILSAEETIPDLWITPDLAMCETCRAELENPADRRYHYPFITCTQCGPRYSVMKALPFERTLTTMDPFRFCEVCAYEFENPADRRFYAQTMSCPACGVQMEWRDASGTNMRVAGEDIIQMACSALRQGAIVAVKGIGGFLLMADASNAQAIQQLRTRKHRPSKPFAIMYPGLKDLLKDTTLSAVQKKILTSPEAPIVLLPISEAMRTRLATEALAPGLDKLGIMLPYAPLLHLMAKSFGRPMVATSGNVSGAPICFTNDDALTSLKGIADYFLLHNREIVAPQDDSVISLPDEDYPPIMLRRSRGFAPACEAYKTQSHKSVLATGALMKSSFALAHHHRVYVSQYLGNTDSYEAQQAYKHTLNHMQQLLHFEPELILTDTHPQYFSHQLAHQLAAEKSLPLHTVQHHEAHFAAILGESGLMDAGTKILGIIWDGTGLGDDGHSWGGEFFTFEKNTIQRKKHVGYFPYLLGDKMAVEPRISALAALHGSGSEWPTLVKMFTDSEWRLYQQMLNHYNGIYTSSVGRLFDAASCLITGITRQSYEGEAAMKLEALANSWCKRNGLHIHENYFTEIGQGSEIDAGLALTGVLHDLEQNREPAFIAAKFHASMAQLVEAVAKQHGTEHICFSGGVFQNTLLVNMIIALYGKKFKLHFHKYLSPNDENISFGQLVYHDKGIKKEINQY